MQKSLRVFWISLFFVFTSSALAVDYSLPNKEWRLISLPAAPPAAENSVENLFGDDISGIYGTGWTLFEYDSRANQYRRLNKTAPVKQGVGYWIIQLSGNTVTLDLPAGSHASASSIALTSSKNQNPQWNLVGSPFLGTRSLGDFSVKVANGDICGNSGCNLDQAKDKQLAHNKVWIYSGQAYEEKGVGDMINPWEGFWLPTLPDSSGYHLSLATQLASNYIDRLSVSDDGVNLNLKMAGNFIEGSHFSFFIDADNDSDTGYTKGSFKGIDFMLEDNRLYRYPLGAQGWSWGDPIQTNISVNNSSTQAMAVIPFNLLNVGSVIKYSASVASNDWTKINNYTENMVVHKMGGEGGIKLFIIGDSTVHNNDIPDGNGGFRELGWGDVLNEYMLNPQHVFNEARSGASSKSYKKYSNDKHDWNKTKELINATDISDGGYLLIQFGHNDKNRNDSGHTMPGRYNSFYDELKVFIDESHEMGLTPVLVTPIEEMRVERLRQGDHTHITLDGDYPQTIRDLASDEHVLLLDLEKKSFNEFLKYEKSEDLVRVFAYDDHTHFNPKGARIVAGWVKQLVCEYHDRLLCTQFR
jgi:lysophospholipase L1-like esterase